MSTSIELRYKGNQSVPKHIQRGILFLAKTGFMKEDLWCDFFSEGTMRSRRRSARRLVESGHLTIHPNEAGQRIYLLGRKSENWLRSSGIPFVRGVHMNQLTHDAILSRSVARLDQAGIIGRWRTEKELKRDRDRLYAVKESSERIKYPDLIFTLNTPEGELKSALELEQTQKSRSRYKSIILAYERMTDLAMVLFIVETDAIRTVIQGLAKRYASSALRERMAFAMTKTWQSDPFNADIEVKNGSLKLKNVCGLKSMRQAA
jgi:hypothetical protein